MFKKICNALTSIVVSVIRYKYILGIITYSRVVTKGSAELFSSESSPGKHGRSINPFVPSW